MIPVISIVVPVYNEEEVLPEFYRRTKSVLDGLGLSHEFLFVDDGSRDRTPEILESLASKDPCVKALKFSRNFGHQTAFAAGLEHVQADAAITMDGDLQHPPEMIPTLIAKWKEGYNVVYTVRQNTEGAGWLKEAAIRWTYRFINALGGIRMEIGAADFRLMDRKVLDCLKQFEERRRFLRGLIAWVGFRQAALPYNAAPRTLGQAKYNFMRLANLALDGILSFSHHPLRIAGLCGLLISGLGFAYAIFAVASHFWGGKAPTGWTSLLVSVLMVGGIQLIFLGILGEYLGRMYEEVKRRPLYIIEKTIGFKL